MPITNRDGCPCNVKLDARYERLPETLAGLHYVAFVILMLKNIVKILS
jgi:hypothetical protein